LRIAIQEVVQFSRHPGCVIPLGQLSGSTFVLNAQSWI
jgi:hypothetical protein